MLTGFILAIMVAVVAFMIAEGLWSNFIMFFNVMMAALVAMSYWEPLADKLNQLEGSFTYFWDFLSLWLIFAVTLGILRVLSDRLSNVRVRFFKPVEMAGGIFFALWTAWIVGSFALTSLHTAPLAQHSFGGDFQPKIDEYMFFGLGPDRKWLAFNHSLSEGAYSKSTTNTFDPDADFVLRYDDRRAQFEKEGDFRVNRPKSK